MTENSSGAQVDPTKPEPSAATQDLSQALPRGSRTELEVVETRQVLDMVSVLAGDLAPARTARGLA